MPGRQGHLKRSIVSEEDSCAVLVRRRMVNTYCRACPRQVAEKHHFLTPDTPIVDEMELPSRLLRESVSGYESSQLVSQPSTGDRLDGSYMYNIHVSNGTSSRIQSVTSKEHSRRKWGIQSCNLDPISMELTCSTDVQDLHTHKSVEGGVCSSIDKKLQFLKQTLACELHRMSATPTDTHQDISITPSHDPRLTSTHSSHPHTLTQSTTSTAHTPHNTATVSLNAVKAHSEKVNPILHNTTENGQDETKMAEKTDNGRKAVNMQRKTEQEEDGQRERLGIGVSGLERESMEQQESDRERQYEMVGQDTSGGDEKKHKESNTRNGSANESHVSTEPDSVQLMSYSYENEEKDIAEAGPQHKNTEDDVEENGGNTEGELRGVHCWEEDGDRGLGADSSGSDMEVARGAVEGAMNSPPIATDSRRGSPLTISPGLPEAISEARFSVDLNGLCGLSTNDISSRSQEKRHEIRLTDEGARKDKGTKKETLVLGRDKTRLKKLQVKRHSATGVSGTKKTLTIKRKMRKKTIRHALSSTTSSTVSSSVCPQSSIPTSAAMQSCPVLQVGAGPGPMEGSGCLEEHFNHLQITPILPPSHSHTLTKSQAPLTSTPTQAQGSAVSSASSKPAAASEYDNLKNTPDPQHHTLTPALFTHHSTEYPLTSTPILPNHTHLPSSPTHSLVAALEKEMMERENIQQEGGLVICQVSRQSSHRAEQSDSSGVGSTMERLMDFDVIGYQASTVLDFSSLPQTSCVGTTAAQSKSRNKTILSRVWQKKTAGRSNTRRVKNATQCKKNFAPKSKTCRPRRALREHSGPSSTTNRPKSATHGRPNRATSKCMVDSNLEAVCIDISNNTKKASGVDHTDATGDQSRPKTTKHRPNLASQQQRRTQKDSSCLKTDHAGKKRIRTHKSGTSNHKPKNRKTKTISTTKKTRRQYIVPAGLRHKERIKKSRTMEQSLPQNNPRETFSSKAYPECILVQHQPVGQSDKLPLMSSHIAAISLDNSSVPEDILTQVLRL